MPTLPKDLRGKLEKVVLAAREEATKGAEAALTALGVGDARKPGHLDAEGEKLRRRLRARGRQAGDRMRPDDSQETGHLAQEAAYEHWHRMLFARFLAENELLRHPEMGVAVSLEECEELARDEGLDRWELAASYAQHMLPEVFRQDDPALKMRLPTEATSKLTAILNGLPATVFTADDSLGWTYQFWQTKRKEQVNRSGVKIGADELPAVTQLFTEDYMVEFLLHNTLGAWWAGKLGPIQAANEEDARTKAALPERDGIGITWTYLRFIQDEETQAWKPAAGTFEGWPEVAKDITFLDPCMGSGHFPVFTLPILARLRMEEEKFGAAEAVHAVLRDNIHGLELDPRCCQIGAFNLALTGWKLGDHQPLPALHVACSGLAPQARLADWVALAGDSEKLQRGMERLYDLFGQAPILGSLINPRMDGGDLLYAQFEELLPLLKKAMKNEPLEEGTHELAVTAQGIAKAAELLGGVYTLIATNVPYLGRGKQSSSLRGYLEQMHPDAKTDLATCFIERSLAWCATGGHTALVSPQNWWFLTSYRNFREQFLNEQILGFIASLGEEAWQAFGDRGPVATLVIVSSKRPTSDQITAAIDALPLATISEKESELRNGPIRLIEQERQRKNPDSRITVSLAGLGPLLDAHSKSYEGLTTGDLDRFVQLFWEHPQLADPWETLIGSPNDSIDYCAREQIIFWEGGTGSLASSPTSYIKGERAWGRVGLRIAQTRNLVPTIYRGEIFDKNAATIIPNKESEILPIYCYAQSRDFADEVRKIDQAVKVTVGTLVKVPFDLARWRKVAAERYPKGLPIANSDDPTQWLFNGQPKGSEQPLHVAVARLLGYLWPRQTGSSFPDCPALEPDGLEQFADDDCIVCLTPVRGEESAANRMRVILHAALGTYDEAELITSSGKKGSKARGLENWLRDNFFAQHCDQFQSRPFIWHLWDGRKDGFHALVNYHQLAGPNGAGRRTLESLTYGYLGDWITRQKDGVNQGEAGAEDRLAAALELQEELKKILAGEPPYDLFVRWKPLHEQPIGWEPNINDGVRINGRPFMVADLSRGRKGAGLFRSKVNLKWTKDRGKEPARPKEDYPWFWNWDEQTEDFTGSGKEPDGNRWNALHYTTEFKQAARDRHEQQED